MIATCYSAGFSTGESLVSANNDKTMGGECLAGLTLSIIIRGGWVGGNAM